MEDIIGGKCGAKNENRIEGKCLEKGKYLFGKKKRKKSELFLLAKKSTQIGYPSSKAKY